MTSMNFQIILGHIPIIPWTSSENSSEFFPILLMSEGEQKTLDKNFGCAQNIQGHPRTYSDMSTELYQGPMFRGF